MRSADRRVLAASVVVIGAVAGLLIWLQRPVRGPDPRVRLNDVLAGSTVRDWLKVAGQPGQPDYPAVTDRLESAPFAVVPVLSAALDDPSPAVRRGAVGVIGEWHRRRPHEVDADTRARVDDRIHDGSPNVQWAVIDHTPNQHRVAEWAQSPDDAIAEPALTRLIARGEFSEPDLRAIFEYCRRKGLDPWAPYPPEPESWRFHEEVYRAPRTLLGWFRVRPENGARVALPYLSAPDPEDRARALFALQLAHTMPDELIPKIEPLFADPDRKVRRAALMAVLCLRDCRWRGHSRDPLSDWKPFLPPQMAALLD